METTRSTDGTRIAYETRGDGPLVVVVGGAFNDRSVWVPLTEALAEEGFRAVTYDRRGRGDSDDAPPSVEREVEDLLAVLAAAGGEGEEDGAATFLHGVSSGAALVLQALAAGVPATAASGLEPPYRVDGAPPAPDRYIATLQEMVDRDDREGLVEYFHTQVVGLPLEMLEPARQSPAWPAMLRMAPTLVGDGLALGGDDHGLPRELLGGIRQPFLVVSSTGTPIPWLETATTALADALPEGAVVRLEGGFHEVPTPVLAPALAAFYRAYA